MAAGLVSFLATSPAQAGAHANVTWMDFLKPSYAAMLEKAGASTSDRGQMERWAERAAAGLSTFVDGGCDKLRFTTNFCGLQFMTIPTTSMVPTLLEQDVVAIVPYAGDQRPKRGDIIVFRTTMSSSSSGLVMVARLIGLSGDTVALSKGVVTVNAATFDSRKTEQTAVSLFGDRMTVWSEEMPDGSAHLIAMTTDTAVDTADNVAAITVPVGRYFVLGDNRHNSVDSRYPDQMGEKGFVLEDNVLGRLTVIVAAPDPLRIGEVLR